PDVYSFSKNLRLCLTYLCYAGVQHGVAAHARNGLAGALTGGKGVTDTTAAADQVPLRHHQDAATLLISLEDDAMNVKVGWTVGVAPLLLILGTPQVSRPEATISFTGRRKGGIPCE